MQLRGTTLSSTLMHAGLVLPGPLLLSLLHAGGLPDEDAWDNPEEHDEAAAAKHKSAGAVHAERPQNR